MQSFNQELFLFINSFANLNTTIDSVFIAIAEYMPYFFIIFEVVLYFILKLKDEAMFAFTSMLMALSFSKIISIFYIHNRPFVDNLGVTLSSHAPDSSFPSDHTTFMASIAISLFFYKKSKKLSIILIFLALISGLARVYEGVHYPFDILGAFIIAFVSSYIIFKINNKLQIINNFIKRFI